jgi:hypothetical protein
MSGPETTLKHGQEFPYDESAGPSKDWAHAAARGVIADLADRRGIKNGFYDVDEDIREEIVASLAEIIRLAHKESQP